MTSARDFGPGLEPNLERTRERSAGRSSGIVAASLLFHLLLLVLLVHRGRVWIAPVRLPGTSHGTSMVLTYLRGPAPSAPSSVAKTPRKRVRPLLVARLPVPSPVVQPAPAETVHQNSGSGVDPLGEGDASIALMQFFPDPKPDLTRLPHGSRGDVVLEAVISAEGRIAQLTIKQGLGYGVDESVIATVEQWTFHPALRDGKPVASQQEFHFHYERG